MRSGTPASSAGPDASSASDELSPHAASRAATARDTTPNVRLNLMGTSCRPRLRAVDDRTPLSRTAPVLASWFVTLAAGDLAPPAGAGVTVAGQRRFRTGLRCRQQTTGRYAGGDPASNDPSGARAPPGPRPVPCPWRSVRGR